jgi:hypothetical protein
LKIEDALDLAQQCIRRNTGQEGRLEFIIHNIETKNEISQGDEDYIVSLKSVLEESIIPDIIISKESKKDKGSSENLNNCTFCGKKLGFRKFKVDKSWQIVGKPCKECHNEIKAGIYIFNATYKDGISSHTEKTGGVIIIHNFKTDRRIIFVANKLKFKITISKNNILGIKKVQYTDDSISAIIKSKIGKESKKSHMLITYSSTHINQSPVFDVDDLDKALEAANYMMLKN